MSEVELQSIVVTVDDEHLPSIQDLALTLQSAGMLVEQILPTAGIITGRAPANIIPTLPNLSGVVAVEADETMQAL
jgi:hypothetical protein